MSTSQPVSLVDAAKSMLANFNVVDLVEADGTLNGKDRLGEEWRALVCDDVEELSVADLDGFVKRENPYRLVVVVAKGSEGPARDKLKTAGVGDGPSTLVWGL